MNLHAWVLQPSRVKSQASLQWIDSKQTTGWRLTSRSFTHEKKKSRHKTRKWWSPRFSYWSHVKSTASVMINSYANKLHWQILASKLGRRANQVGWGHAGWGYAGWGLTGWQPDNSSLRKPKHKPRKWWFSIILVFITSIQKGDCVSTQLYNVHASCIGYDTSEHASKATSKQADRQASI